MIDNNRYKYFNNNSENLSDISVLNNLLSMNDIRQRINNLFNIIEIIDFKFIYNLLFKEIHTDDFFS